MTFAEYLARDDAKSLTQLATDIGVSTGRLSQLKSVTDWPPSLALDVEAATDGLLDAGELSPVIKRARESASPSARR